jgi:hypothetical protein
MQLDTCVTEYLAAFCCAEGGGYLQPSTKPMRMNEQSFNIRCAMNAFGAERLTRTP